MSTTTTVAKCAHPTRIFSALLLGCSVSYSNKNHSKSTYEAHAHFYPNRQRKAIGGGELAMPCFPVLRPPRYKWCWSCGRLRWTTATVLWKDYHRNRDESVHSQSTAIVHVKAELVSLSIRESEVVHGDEVAPPLHGSGHSAEFASLRGLRQGRVSADLKLVLPARHLLLGPPLDILEVV